MTRETFERATKLIETIEYIFYITEYRTDYPKGWIKITIPTVEQHHYFPDDFEDDLTEWLIQKAEQYKKEFEQL